MSPSAKAARARHVLLLRGINVGAANRIAMKDFARLLGELGCREVRTYIQSGNAVFEAEAELARRLPAELSAAFERQFSMRVPVVLRSAREYRAAVGANPFLARKGIELEQLHVAFLADKPSAARAATLDPARSPGDEFALVGRELYLRLGAGVANSKLTNAYLDARLGTVSTARNWRTVLALLELLEAEAAG